MRWACWTGSRGSASSASPPTTWSATRWSSGSSGPTTPMPPSAGASLIDVEIEEPAWTAAEPRAAALAHEAALAVLNHQGREGDGVAVLLTDDAVLRDLNARFRGK